MRDPFVDNIFFTATLIELVARKTQNTRRYVAEKLGMDGIAKVYQFADVNHCLSMDQNCDELIRTYGLMPGTFAPEKDAETVPSPFAIGQNYAWMVQDLQPDPNKYPETLYNILTSKISEWMTFYDNAFYYSPVDYLVGAYKALQKGNA